MRARWWQRKAAKPTGPERVLVTPEGISLTVRVAGVGQRIGALILDLTFILVLMIATTMTLVYIAGGLGNFANTMSRGDQASSAFQFLLVIWIIALFLFRNAYFLFFELGPRGATPGKRIAGIRIAARDGGRLSAQMVIARNLLRDIELFLPLPMIMQVGLDSGWGMLAALAWLLIFMLFPLFNRDHLRAGDVIAGSWVLERPKVKLQAALSASQGPSEALSPSGEGEAPIQAAYRFNEAQLGVYGEYELQSLERVLRDGNTETIENVYQTIAAKIGREDGWGDERRFLTDYYTQLRARLEAGMRMGRRKANKHA